MKKPYFLIKNYVLVLILILTSCIHKETELLEAYTERKPQALDPISSATSVAVYFGANVPDAIKSRITNLMRNSLPKFGNSPCTTGENHIDFYFGNHEKSQISVNEKNSLKSNEGFVIKSTRSSNNSNCLSISVDGRSDVQNDIKASRGVSYGAYAVLQDLGFKFLHPLKAQADGINLDLSRLAKISRQEEPFWKTRAVHLHTMHPLELTNLLNGWGVSGPADSKGWDDMLPYWSMYLEWLTAHKQNGVEWMLLWTPEAGNFNQSELRQSRLKKLTSLAKDWGVDVGVVTPVRFVQQNGWTLLRHHEERKNKPNEERDNINEILTNIDWILQCGFTAIGGELGEGEFSSAPPQNTIQELNAIADHLAQQNPPVPYRVKVHVSKNQVATGYKDPMTQKDINFNYLPLYANSKVGVMPHTVQIYSLNDPAPTYENTDFMDMFRFTKMAATGSVNNTKREVLFYPETAYWVSYDVDVPLFLPVYPYRRVQDLRMLAHDQLAGDMKKKNTSIDGQMIFSSGWDWGYWFNDVITAEAAWNPHMEAINAAQAFQKIITDVFRLNPNETELPILIATIAINQHKLLVQGMVNSKPPSVIEKRTGIAYLAGVDTFDEIPMWTRENLPSSLKTAIPLTQPNKFREDWSFTLPHLLYMNEIKYNSELKPLLSSMSQVFQSDANKMKSFATTKAPFGLSSALQDFVDGTQITANRANFVFNLYEARLAKSKFFNSTATEALYEKLGRILSSTESIAQRRKNSIPMQPEHRALITGWKNNSVNNPTDYHFGYVWTSYNLFYWKREYNKLRWSEADKATCYMNIIQPAEVVGKKDGPVEYIKDFTQLTGYLKSCTTIPVAEPDVNKGW
jgi:hypothetical protein